MLKWNKVSHALITCPFILLLSACSGMTVSQTTSDEPDTVKVVVLPYLSFAPFHIAQEEGYFTEQDLEVEFVEFDDNAAALSALIQGQIDVGAGFVGIGELNAMANDAAIHIVADKGHASTQGCVADTFMISTRLTTDGQVPDDFSLAGLQAGIGPASIEAYLFDLLLAQTDEDLSLSDFDLQDVPPFVELDALNEGTLDLIMASEPWITRIEEAGAGISWVPLGDVEQDFQSAAVVFGPTLLDENPDVGKRFMTAYLKAVRQYNEGATERNLTLLSESLDLEQDLLKQLCWPHINNDGSINLQSVMNFQQWSVDNGYLDQAASEDQIWDGQFVEEARKNLEEE